MRKLDKRMVKGVKKTGREENAHAFSRIYFYEVAIRFIFTRDDGRKREYSCPELLVVHSTLGGERILQMIYYDYRSVDAQFSLSLSLSLSSPSYHLSLVFVVCEKG